MSKVRGPTCKGQYGGEGLVVRAIIHIYPSKHSAQTELVIFCADNVVLRKLEHLREAFS